MRKNMKSKLGIILAGLLVFTQAAMAASSQSLTVSASIPTSTSMAMSLATLDQVTSKVVASTPTGNKMAFGALTYDTTNHIYVPSTYYAMSLSGKTNVTYTEGSNPNGTTNGLGFKATATFVTVNAKTNVETVSSLGKKRLIDLKGTVGELTNIPSGSYEKVYVGIWTGSKTAPADPANGQPFTTLDKPGNYTGTLTFTTVAS
jgi:hypothetical protein